MKTKELRPIRERPEYYEAIERELDLIFRREIYVPLMRELNAPAKELRNAMDDLLRAISSGQIVYRAGRYEGSFDAAVSRELKALGAVWSKGAWKLSPSKITPDMRVAAQASESRAQRMAEKIAKRISRIVPEKIAESAKLEKLFDRTVFQVNKDFNETLKSLSIKSNLSPQQAQEIARDYTNNMKLYIKDWAEKEIVELRTKMESHAKSGSRYEDMVKTIKESYGVSQNKAKFLARQETSLLMTKFKEVRYKAAGINQYKWRCVVGSPLHPVRPMHKALDGKIFSWDDPPVVDEKGDRKHPGQDYNCRCTSIPIVKF